MTRASFPSFACHEASTSSQRPYVIQPYYTGRDKGALHAKDGKLLLFMNEGRAWRYVFTTAQPDDDRAADNYTVITLREYLGEYYDAYAEKHGRW